MENCVTNMDLSNKELAFVSLLIIGAAITIVFISFVVAQITAVALITPQ